MKSCRMEEKIMYHRRVKVVPVERSFYLVTNRVVGGSFFLVYRVVNSLFYELLHKRVLAWR